LFSKSKKIIGKFHQLHYTIKSFFCQEKKFQRSKVPNHAHRVLV